MPVSRVGNFCYGPPMLTIRDLKKSHGGRVLFEKAGMQVNYGERVALVGPNGAGKSTLFSIILKHDTPDSGHVDRDEWTMVGYLPQEGEAVGEETVMDIATGRAGEIDALDKKLRAFEQDGNVDSPDYNEANMQFEALNDPQVEAKAKSILAGLGYNEKTYTKKAKELSGGWVMRAHLARLLVMQPDLLLLDEPTNHLDLNSLIWLQEYLKSYSGAVLLISHDRYFMDELAQTVYEIENQRLVAYKSNYTEFLEKRQANYENNIAAYKNQQKQIKALNEFIDKFRSVSSKAAQAQSRQKELERMELVEKPMPPKKPFKFQIPQPERGGQRAISLEDVDFAYGDHVVYEGLSLSVERGERTVLVGPNGAGKSTLLKLLAGVLQPGSGRVNEGHNAKIGYFSQHRADTLDPEKTILEEVLEAGNGIREEDARGILGTFLFRKDAIYKKTAVLSGGEKSRLNLIKFLVDPPNLLLMDEPTTHLDIHTVESLILALKEYDGTLVFISHDVHFIRQLASKVLHVNGGQIIPYPGGYDYFIEKSAAVDDRAAVTMA